MENTPGEFPSSGTNVPFWTETFEFIQKIELRWKRLTQCRGQFCRAQNKTREGRYKKKRNIGKNGAERQFVGDLSGDITEKTARADRRQDLKSGASPLELPKKLLRTEKL